MSDVKEMVVEGETKKRKDLDKVVEDTPTIEPSKKRRKRQLAFSYIPDSYDKTIEYVAGIDEAGRGPVLGPMVYSIAFYPYVDNDKKLRKIGFNDSKQLSETQRDSLFEKIHQHDVGFIVDPLSAQELSREMLKIDRRGLNRISHDSAMGLIGKVLEHGFKIKALFVDTVGPPEKYQQLLQDQFPAVGSIIVSKKADSIYPIVGAASICAKVLRDRLLSEWEFKENIPLSKAFGSGYPADENTKKWLQNNMNDIFGFPSLVRYSWKTTTACLVDAVQVYWSFEDMQAHEELEQHSRMSPKKQESLREASNRAQTHKANLLPLRKRYQFFGANGMTRVKSGFF